MSWCIRGVMVNQHCSPELASCEYANIDHCTRFKVGSVGEYVLSLYDVPSGYEWIFGGTLYMIALTALLTLMQTYTDQLVEFALPSEQLTLLISVLLNTIFFLFMGFNPPASAIQSGFRWLCHVVPKRYSFSILAALVFTDCPTDDGGSNAPGCQPLVGAPPTMQPYANVRGYVESVFGARHDDVAQNVGVVLLAIVVIRVLGLLALCFINHQKRQEAY